MATCTERDGYILVIIMATYTERDSYIIVIYQHTLNMTVIITIVIIMAT